MRLQFLSLRKSEPMKVTKTRLWGSHLAYSKHAHAQIAGVSNRLELSLRECGINALLAASFLSPSLSFGAGCDNKFYKRRAAHWTHSHVSETSFSNQRASLNFIMFALVLGGVKLISSAPSNYNITNRFQQRERECVVTRPRGPFSAAALWLQSRCQSGCRWNFFLRAALWPTLRTSPTTYFARPNAPAQLCCSGSSCRG